MWQYERDKEDNLVGLLFQQRVELLPSGGQSKYKCVFDQRSDPQFSCESDYAHVVISDAVVKRSVFWFRFTSILLYEDFLFPLEMVRPKPGGMLRFRRSPSRVMMQHCRVIHAVWFDSGR